MWERTDPVDYGRKRVDSPRRLHDGASIPHNLHAWRLQAQTGYLATGRRGYPKKWGTTAQS